MDDELAIASIIIGSIVMLILLTWIFISEKNELLKQRDDNIRNNNIRNKNDFTQSTAPIIQPKPSFLKELVRIAIKLSDATKELKTKTDSSVLQCEAILFFTAILLDVIINKCQDKSLVIKVVNGLVPEIKEFLLKKYEPIFSTVNIDDFIYNRLTTYREELSNFESDPQYNFPKTTFAMYSTEFSPILKDMYTYENIVINASIPIWRNSLRAPLQECLTEYNKNNII